ncbi:MAG: MFS transporter [Anaerolineae bacterium]
MVVRRFTARVTLLTAGAGQVQSALMGRFSAIDRRLLTILLIVLVQMVGSSMVLPILPLFAKEQFDLPPQSITLLGTVFFAGQFIAGPYLGRMSDRSGRLPVLILSQVGTAISFVMLAAAPSAWWLYAARILDGITGGNIIVAQAYITDVTPRERRTESLGYVFAVFGLGFMIGPAIGGALSAAFGPRVPYLIAAVAAAAVVALTWATLDETLSPEQRAANRAYGRDEVDRLTLLRDRRLLLILVVAFTGQFGLGQMQATFALYGEAVLFAGEPASTVSLGIGLLLATVGFGQFLTQAVLLRRALRVTREEWLVVIGNSLRTAMFFGLALTTSPMVAGVGTAIYAVGSGVMMPSLQSLATTSTADELRGAVLGLYQSSVGLAIIASTAIAGVLFAAAPALPFWVAGALGLVALVPAAALVREAGAGSATR